MMAGRSNQLNTERGQSSSGSGDPSDRRSSSAFFAEEEQCNHSYSWFARHCCRQRPWPLGRPTTLHHCSWSVARKPVTRRHTPFAAAQAHTGQRVFREGRSWMLQRARGL
jgi:hypothetical protein